ncbi:MULTISPECIES: DUF7511 domain-containing protein [Natronococcus]|uniref:DUF7511 domain-containing protein n=1 Tax=Natronococcus jeotgali DSM 18795 TaxID=1227498 RepID=L9WRH9_9EURY|nr:MULTISPECIES: hypothetical protein [Natronococcus]ELY52089.1 hypothetical protein C492_20216 [Natronococcus jeotgali DSM 18795]NKE36336.1 hypothetical protein [Natronococcus sp. JC468]
MTTNTNDVDTRQSAFDETSIELDSVTIQHNDAPNECAMFPRDASDIELMTNWIAAYDDGFVRLESMR